MLLIPELSFKHALITWTHNFFFISRSADHLRPEPWGLIRMDHGKPMNRCTTSGVEWFDTASSAHYFGFASTAYCNSSTFIWDRKKHPNRRHWFFSVASPCVSGCVIDTVTWPNKLRMGKNPTQRQLDGNKYQLLISDQFYLSGRCRYVKKLLTSADKDITADISCIPSNYGWGL